VTQNGAPSTSSGDVVVVSYRQSNLAFLPRRLSLDPSEESSEVSGGTSCVESRKRCCERCWDDWDSTDETEMARDRLYCRAIEELGNKKHLFMKKKVAKLQILTQKEKGGITLLIYDDLSDRTNRH
jgi:hypothetical protein